MTANSRRRCVSAPVRVPSTLWALGPEPLDPGDRWPQPLLARAIAEFSEPGSRVMPIGWPAPTARGTLTVIEPDTADALAAIGDLDRHGLDAPTDRVRSREPVDLVIASLLGDHLDPVAADHVTALATEVMTQGGLLVVLSRCHHSDSGVLSDPAGPVVAAAQAADLLYLQHIIAAPISGTTITTAPYADPCSPALARHRVAHTDVFVFLQPSHG